MARRVANHDAVERAIANALGPPVADSLLALRRWICPACGGGLDDPLQLWRPLTLHDDGRLVCDACDAAPGVVLAAVARIVDAGTWRDLALQAVAVARRAVAQLDELPTAPAEEEPAHP